MTNRFFPEIQGRFGFGCMRLPTAEGRVDVPQFCDMVDAFLAGGLNYFDTAHGYHGGQSELALKAGLTSRYPRDRYVLADKLSTFFFTREEEIRPLFAEQLRCCGVEYFDFYLMHSQNAATFQKYKDCRAYETAFALKAEGKVRHVGISFHDKPEVLDRILTEYPQIEAVQIQFNYADYESPAVESRKVYETAVRHGKPVIVMEPVKGGCLATLPEAARAAFDEVGGGTSASYALRFAAGFENMMMVLSGMSTIGQVNENVAFMADPQPLTEAEQHAVAKARQVFDSLRLIPCTSCRYCVLDNDCPQKIRIPEIFNCFNLKNTFHNPESDSFYRNILTREGGRASDCVRCGQCEEICPQHLPIRELLEKAAAVFDA